MGKTQCQRLWCSAEPRPCFLPFDEKRCSLRLPISQTLFR
uniref:Uncharacterized protein n=1 Tax=Siphoviridae sp. ctbvd11 TaxID=2825567 RepID=A0A8S5QCU4_9CAUD|nr:MAG TPA: hypothetical protein [Siphoviridae sp. ctbvd11]